MSTTSLDDLKNELARRGLVTGPLIEDTFVYGPGRVAVAGGDVMVNVDPEVEERGAFEAAALADAVERVLNVSPDAWSTIIEHVATEVEEAVGDEEVIETTDLRDDLELKSIVVFVDAVLLSFDAPRQFPDSVVRMQLDEDLAVDDFEIDDREH